MITDSSYSHVSVILIKYSNLQLLLTHMKIKSHKRIFHITKMSSPRQIRRTDNYRVFFLSFAKKVGIILGMGAANEKRSYIVTSWLIGWAHTQNDSGTGGFDSVFRALFSECNKATLWCYAVYCFTCFYCQQNYCCCYCCCMSYQVTKQ